MWSSKGKAPLKGGLPICDTTVTLWCPAACTGIPLVYPSVEIRGTDSGQKLAFREPQKWHTDSQAHFILPRGVEGEGLPPLLGMC